MDVTRLFYNVRGYLFLTDTRGGYERHATHRQAISQTQRQYEQRLTFITITRNTDQNLQIQL